CALPIFAAQLLAEHPDRLQRLDDVVVAALAAPATVAANHPPVQQFDRILAVVTADLARLGQQRGTPQFPGPRVSVPHQGNVFFSTSLTHSQHAPVFPVSFFLSQRLSPFPRTILTGVIFYEATRGSRAATSPS